MPLPNTETRIFLDSGSAEHTQDILDKLGFLDGQTTNPSYFVKSNPAVIARKEAGEKFSQEGMLEAYRQLAEDISALVPLAPEGSVSIEVYADKKSTAEDLVDQAHEMYAWIPNAHIKLPIIPAGLEAAEQLVSEGIRLNMTLCFAQEQAAAVHAVTRGAMAGQVFVSPFVSRLDKQGENGLDLLANVKKMYGEADSSVEVLAASVHSLYDIAWAIEKEMDIITIPYEDLLAWINASTPAKLSGLDKKDTSGLAAIKYRELDLTKDWRDFDISHPLTDAGLEAFAKDWNGLLK